MRFPPGADPLLLAMSDAIQSINGDGLIDAYLVDTKTLRAEKLPLEAGLNGFPALAQRKEIDAVHMEIDKYKFESAVDVYRALARKRP